MAVDRSKRINVSISDEIYHALDDWADQQGRPLANLAAFLLERSIAQAKDSGEFRPSSGRSGDDNTNDLAKSFIKDLALGRVQNILDVQRLADQLGVPSERLAQIINQNGESKKNARSKT